MGAWVSLHLVGALAAAASSGGVDPFLRGLDARAEAARERYRVPGASVAVLRGGRVVAERSYGRTVASDEGAPVTPETVFQVASLSKPVAALGVVLLAAEGVLDLDAPISAYLERWSLPPSSFDARLVTARRLLSHRGGINIHGYPGLAPDSPIPGLEASLAGENGGAGAVRLDSRPGELRYSSGGYTILQLLVEEVSGLSFGDYMQRRVLAPLGMSSSSFEPHAGMTMATGHGWWGKPLPSYRFRAQAASGLLATAGDIARFLSFLGREDLQRRLGLSPQAVAEMVRPPGDHRNGFGLGLSLEAVAGTTVVSHTGANRGWRAILGSVPATGDGIVVLTNSDRGLPMTTDLLCKWGRSTIGAELASCWVERKSRGTMTAVAGLLGVGLVMDAWAFLGRRRRVRARPWGAPERYRWLSWTRLVLSLVVMALWWLFWYTDSIVVLREGIENFVPVSSTPPTFVWLTLVLTLWCLLGVVRWLHVVRSSREAAASGATAG